MAKYDKKTSERRRTPGPAPRPNAETAYISDNPQLPRIAAWLKKVKFRKKTFGGLDPADVWKKLGELNGLYEQALMAERIRYELKLKQVKREAAEDALLRGRLPEEDPDG